MFAIFRSSGSRQAWMVPTTQYLPAPSSYSYTSWTYWAARVSLLTWAPCPASYISIAGAPETRRTPQHRPRHPQRWSSNLPQFPRNIPFYGLRRIRSASSRGWKSCPGPSATLPAQRWARHPHHNISRSPIGWADRASPNPDFLRRSTASTRTSPALEEHSESETQGQRQREARSEKDQKDPTSSSCCCLAFFPPPPVSGLEAIITRSRTPLRLPLASLPPPHPQPCH